MLRSIGILVAAAALLAAVPAPAAPTQTVVIDNFSFKPNRISVPAGTRLVFENRDDLPHTVVIPDLQQKSKMLDTDDSYEAVMDKPGTYGFFCGVHPMMKGEIVVTEK